ncbi:LysR family transcriptional regulator, hydrogen peroxide-inducible genes activator [Flexibacter flexilis DSM 6793]|uniref:LysR family transcriptional regulator, hydrogen peroxide-inducible genes activator n=1 Tax=Flexibacter flexilis DSM 6793 TaxID=927664 RepID=A0A1I1NHL3_9BACT|nr:hydrogen peroxide-inducible genes activator [Flexibacter flexilis]SFC96916.1 LysR family transcriptional regulator, hydrogen peroxide-inducible genes activator [Flexibacter flexilis DSM 6793]
MNFQQLEYLVAVDTHRHFAKAAESCFVTQATLSMMLKKLEEELDVILFDRSKQPVVPTAVGVKVITQARRILSEANQLKDIVLQEKGELTGELRVGIIPTVAPYLLPLFLKNFTEKYPKISLYIHEYTTANIIEKLKSGEIDVGILATPLHEKTIVETPLYYEQYFLYANENEADNDKKYIVPSDINLEKLWLLEEGHCMRSQILNLCELKRESAFYHKLHYEAGSIETLMNLVDSHYGITVIPELAAVRLSPAQQKQLRYFAPPSPVREISLVSHYQYVKERLVKALKNSILSAIPDKMKEQKPMQILDIQAQK